jgi:hypothetical protein
VRETSVVLMGPVAPAVELDAQHRHAAELGAMNLAPGALVSITARATDACYTGAQTAQSRTVTFRIVSPEELFREILLRQQAERAKFRKLRDAIEAAFGKPPLIYRAGRYGVGENTAAILRESGIAIDSSVRALFDYSGEGGPNFREHPLEPWWVGGTGGLLELPLTTVYWGLLRRQGRLIHPALWRAPRLRGLLARLSLLERIPLTPEGVTVEEAIRGIDIALDDGLPVLVLSFHSPSLQPGHTPYVRDEEDLDALYDWWRRVFAYLASRQVKPTTGAEIRQAVRR